MPKTERKPSGVASPARDAVRGRVGLIDQAAQVSGPERIPWPHTNLSGHMARIAESVERGGPGDAQLFAADGTLVRRQPKRWWEDPAFQQRVAEAEAADKAQ